MNLATETDIERLRQAAQPEIRVFAISQGVASELDYVEGFPYRGTSD